MDAKFCIFNLLSFSQAGRRGFESRLPLQNQATGDCLALDQFHHHVPISDVMERTDVGVIQRRHGACLTLKASTQVLPFRDVFGQHFDGDGAVEPGVPSLVHLTHPSGAQFFVIS